MVGSERATRVQRVWLGTRYQVRQVKGGGSEMEAECGVSIARLHMLQIREMQGKPCGTTTKLAKAGGWPDAKPHMHDR